MALTAWSGALRIIADQSGLEPDEIVEADDMQFTALGINRILAGAILSQMRGPGGEALPKDFFDRVPTVGAFRRYYEKAAPVRPAKLTRTLSPIALSIILQKSPAVAKHVLFLLPDGSGSAMAYAGLPAVHADVCIVGLNSPHLRDASKYTGTIEQLAETWVHEIYRRQPKGPYMVGGWSAGGYYSFEVAKRLLRDGHSVDKLVLIDSPSRTVFESLPIAVVRHLAARNLMGNWGSQDPPEWLIPHFQATVAAVAKYHPTPMSRASQIKTYLIWSRDGVLDTQGMASSGLDARVKVSRFLLQGKQDWGPNGWDDLLPGQACAIATTGGTHFTMVNKPHVAELSALLSDAVAGTCPQRQHLWKQD
ncbi:hypothetical protein CDD82_1122 [Ophiocordyceps australis]|uniref:Thioesterase domain-containing protein n=1 Tax=Ophiocordyceps australis TaxID=1399860 RepID=A0A2C5ZPP7_9HYPO|nr:hypothetical protein CDD82_1122 [Ophiocordyceps australis]